MAMRTFDVGTVFTEVAPIWTSASALDPLARRVVRTLRSGGHVLDVGCGAGEHLTRIRTEAAYQGKRLGLTVGVDIAEGMVARTDARRGVRAAVGDGMRLPFRDQVFDVVVVSLVLHFMDDPVQVARELTRVIRPGGTAIVVYRPRPVGRPRIVPEGLPADSLLRRYLSVPRRFEVASFRRTLEESGCELTEVRAATPERTAWLTRVARASGLPEDLELVRSLRVAPRVNGSADRLLMCRMPGPRNGSMPVRVIDVPGWTPARVKRLLRDLPIASGYELVVKPVWYRKRPHVQAFCEFDAKRITVHVPLPWRPFTERIPYRAKALRSGRRRKRFRFRWYSKYLRFDRPAELIRYLYLHEYYHWYLREVLGRASGAETACDRFALQRL